MGKPVADTDSNSGYLTKARSAAELRSPARDDGTIARILWKLAMVQKNNHASISVGESNEVDELLARAYNARSQLTAAREGGEGEIFDLDNRAGMTEYEVEEESFDMLVPGHFR